MGTTINHHENIKGLWVMGQTYGTRMNQSQLARTLGVSIHDRRKQCQNLQKGLKQCEVGVNGRQSSFESGKQISLILCTLQEIYCGVSIWWGLSQSLRSRNGNFCGGQSNASSLLLLSVSASSNLSSLNLFFSGFGLGGVWHFESLIRLLGCFYIA